MGSKQNERKEVRKASEDLRGVLAENVLLYRKAQGLSQEELADRCELHRTYIGSIERKERNVTLSTLELISHVLGVSVPEILTDKTRDNIE